MGMLRDFAAIWTAVAALVVGSVMLVDWRPEPGSPSHPRETTARAAANWDGTTGSIRPASAGSDRPTAGRAGANTRWVDTERVPQAQPPAPATASTAGSPVETRAASDKAIASAQNVGATDRAVAADPYETATGAAEPQQRPARRSRTNMRAVKEAQQDASLAETSPSATTDAQGQVGGIPVPPSRPADAAKPQSLASATEMKRVTEQKPQATATAQPLHPEPKPEAAASAAKPAITVKPEGAESKPQRTAETKRELQAAPAATVSSAEEPSAARSSERAPARTVAAAEVTDGEGSDARAARRTPTRRAGLETARPRASIRTGRGRRNSVPSETEHAAAERPFGRGARRSSQPQASLNELLEAFRRSGANYVYERTYLSGPRAGQTYRVYR
jgi:hypothetical protein